MSNLYILTSTEQEEFDQPPVLPLDVQTLCFTIDNSLEKEINALRTPQNKIGFLLQYAYFKACKRFFVFGRFTQTHIKHVAKLLGFSSDIDMSSYKKKMPIEHQKKILRLFHYKSFNPSTVAWLKKEITHLIEQQAEPRKVFMHTLDLLHQNKIETPSYNCLADIITKSYIEFENCLLGQVSKHITREDKILLDALLSEGDSPSQTLLNQLKVISQSVKPKAIQASLALFEKVKTYFFKLKPTIESLKLSLNSSIYYATWVQKAKLSQLKQLPDKNKLYFYLLAFIQHQFYLRQDYLTDTLLKCVQTTKNTAIKKLNVSEQLTRGERRKAIRHLSQLHHRHAELIDEINSIAKSSLLTDSGKVQEINRLLDTHTKQQNEKEMQKIELYAKSLNSLAKNEDYFDIVEKLSIKLQHRITGIITSLVFNETSSDQHLIEAIRHLQKNEAQTSLPSHLFLTKEEQEALYTQDKRFKISLYKALLFIHIADSIKAGKLNLSYSYRYKAIHEYLVDEDRWKVSKDELIQSAGLKDIADYQKTMDKLKPWIN